MFDFLFSNSLIEGIALALWGAFVDWWWLILPFAFFYIAKDYWINYNREKFKEKIQWVNLGLKVPRDVLITPKAMEQIFSGISSIASTPDTWLEELLDKKIPYQKGEVPLWISFEIVGNSNGISFFVRAPKKFQRLIETQFRSQYSQVEITEVEDYISEFVSLPNQNQDMWGSELALNEAPIFPIKTYEFFEERVEERRLDSMAPFMEILSDLVDGEEIWLQLVLRGLTKPLADAWKEKSKEKMDELAGREKPEKKKKDFELIAGGLADESMKIVKQFFNDIGSVSGIAGEEAAKEEKKEERKERIQTSGDRDRIEMVERKLSKPVFETVIRVIYHAPKTVFNKDQQSAAINSYFRNFSISSSNGFKGKKKDYFFLYNWFFGDNVGYRDANAFFESFKSRSPDSAPQFELSDDDAKDIMKKMILSAEELATLYHFPITQVEAPRLYRLQTKKYEPPPNLPII